MARYMAEMLTAESSAGSSITTAFGTFGRTTRAGGAERGIGRIQLSTRSPAAITSPRATRLHSARGASRAAAIAAATAAQSVAIIAKRAGTRSPLNPGNQVRSEYGRDTPWRIACESVGRRQSHQKMTAAAG